MPRGIFRLKQVYEEQLSGQWSTKGDVWNTPNPFSGKYNFSYISAGMNNDSPGASDASGYKNRIEKYDFASDTTSVLNDNANLDHNSNDAMGRAYVSSPENQYTIGGGNYFLYASTHGIFKTSYANGTSRSLIVGGMSPDIKSFMGASVNNTSHGYFTRGGTWYDSNSTTNYRIDFSNDYATTVEKGPLTQARKSLAGVGNQSYGYFGGGKGVGSTQYLAATTGYSNVDRLDYSSDSTAMSPKGPLSGARGYVAATGNASYGYFVGGGSATNSNVSTIDRIDYASDTSTASPKGPMTDALWGISASGTPSYGYIFGGSTNAPSSAFGYNPSDTGSYPSNAWRDQADNAKSYVQRIDFSNDTATLSPRGNLRRKLYLTGSTSSQSNANTTPVTLGVNEVRENVSPVLGGFDTGYFAGGYSNYTTVDRIDYSNDTATAAVKGSLSVIRYEFAATGNSSFGYFAGGSPSLSSVDRIDYSNDTPTASAKGPLSTTKWGAGATGTESFGYFGGGGPGISTVDRIDYSNDTATASPKGPLSLARRLLGATGNASFGYFGGGQPSGTVSTVDRIDYSNDTATAVVKGPLSLARNRLAATGNADFGYFGGGLVPGAKSTVDRIDYSNDTATAAAKGPLSVARYQLAATGNLSFGYFGGGSPGISTVDRIDYSSDTGTTPTKGPLSAARMYLAASSSRANAIQLNKTPGILEVAVSFGAFSAPAPQGTDFGYTGGGAYPFSLSTVNRIDYTNDTATALVRGPLSSERWSPTAISSATHGYFIGGGPGSISTIDRIDYSNDTATASVKGPLSSARMYGAAAGNSNFGYFGGGSPGPASTVDRIDYSNDTATTSVKGPLSSVRRKLAATGNADFGYFGGGEVPAVSSRVDRIDYSNDTATASPKGPLSVARAQSNGAGNADFGYFMGGFGSPSPSIEQGVDRVDYSNDTATAVAKGNLAQRRDNHGATGNQSFGYAIAGNGSSDRSDIDRVDYSNDTATALTRGNMTINPYRYFGATSPRENAIPLENIVNYAAGTLETPNTGYFGGGEPGPAKSIVDRIDYSNDTATASVKGSLSVARTSAGATGNVNFGYFGGGKSPSPSSSVDRINYSNDTATAVAKGPLSAARYGLSATGNANFGYFGGGNANGSTVDRIDYSNDTATAAVKGPLSIAKNTGGSSTGNQSFGYFGGSYPAKSTVDRIDYTNDTATALVRGPLSLARGRLAATGNSNFGYFGGGEPGSYSGVDRIDYSNDTGTTPSKGPLSLARAYLSATGNANFGYFGGGNPGPLSTVDRIDYSNDTATASAKGPLSNARHYLSATSARANGFTAVGPSISANFPTISPSSATPQNYGYTLAGDPIVRWSFSNDNDAAVNVNSNPAHGGGGMSGMVSSTTHGYWNRQYSNSPQIYRLDYANDTVNPVQVGSLSSNKTGAGAVHNADYGYWTGGIEYPGGSSFNATSSVQRLDFSNDSANAVAKGNLSHAIKEHRGVGNMDKGYLFKGSILTRIDYSNDTATSTSIGTGGPNTYGGEAGGAGNLNYGWLFGYKNPSTPSSSPGYGTYSGILRLDYANDTGTLSPRGPLLIGGSSRSNGATGNRDQGYFHGGFNGGGLSSVMNKVVYANDTVTAQFKKALFLCPAYNFYDGNSFSAAQNGLPQ